MRRELQVYGNFEGLDADSSNKTKAPNKATTCTNLVVHAGNLETRKGLVRTGVKDNTSSGPKIVYARVINTPTINHGISVEFNGSALIVRHLFI